MVRRILTRAPEESAGTARVPGLRLAPSAIVSQQRINRNHNFGGGFQADHRKVEDLFAKFEAAKGDGKKKALAEQICMELTVHTKIEEDVFYPACEGKVEEDLLKEAYVGHDGAKVLIAEIEAGGLPTPKASTLTSTTLGEAPAA